MADKIDINEADEATLAALPGIGPKLAARIVAYRTAVHPFEELIELAAVPGISERMAREWAGQLSVAETAEPPTPEPPLEEITVLDDNDNEEEMEASLDEEQEVGQEMPPVETAGTEPELGEDPVVVTMLEAEREREPEEMADTPSRAVSLPPASPVERTIVGSVPRRHSHFWQQTAAVVLGTLFGSALTLLLLLLFNGTLRYAPDSRATDLQLQLDEDTSTIRQAQSSMTEEMGTLTGRVTELDNDLAASGEDLEAVADDVGSLQEETAELDQRLETIDQAAEKFDNFLTGMRDLLVALQGLPAVPTTTLTVTATVTATTTVSATTAPDGTPANATPTVTAVPPAGGTVVPTRTPRPTATPLIEN